MSTTNKHKNNNKLLWIILCVLILILILLVCFVFKNSNSINKGNIFKGSSESLGLVNYNNKVFSGLDVILDKQKKEITIDKYKFVFNGTQTDDGEGYYKYSLDIHYDKDEVNSDFFVDDYYIRSTNNYAAKFYIIKVENHYFLVSNLGAEVNGDYFIVIDNNGHLIKSFHNVSLKDIDSDNLSFIVEKCQSPTDSNCDVTTYKLSELNNI